MRTLRLSLLLGLAALGACATEGTGTYSSPSYLGYGGAASPAYRGYGYGSGSGPYSPRSSFGYCGPRRYYALPPPPGALLRPGPPPPPLLRPGPPGLPPAALVRP